MSDPFFLRIVTRNGPFTCHSCAKPGEGKHLELFCWCRFLCLDCADTIGRKLVVLAQIAPMQTIKQDLFAEPGP